MPQLRIIDASWSMDGAGGMVTSGTLTVPLIDTEHPDGPVDWRPTRWESPLAPWGNRIRVSMSVTSDEGVTTTCLLGIGLIMSVETDRPAQTITVELGDLAEELAQWRLPEDHPTEHNASHRWMADRLLEWSGIPRRPTLVDPFKLVSRTQILPADVSWNAGSDAFDVLLDVVRLSSPTNTVRVWRTGEFVATREKDITTVASAAPVATLRDGEGGHLIGLSGRLSRRDAVNSVVVIVEDSNVDDGPVDAGAPPGAQPSPPTVATPQPPGATNPDWQLIFAQEAYKNAIRTISLAHQQIGTGEYGGGRVKYADYFPQYRGQVTEWCGIFVSWLMENMGIPSPIRGRNWVDFMAYIPNAWAAFAPFAGPARNGSIVLFTWQHTGLVVDASTASQGYVTTIEGNANERVMKLRQPMSVCRYFIHPDYSKLSAATRTAPTRRVARFEGDPADTSSRHVVNITDKTPLNYQTGSLGGRRGWKPSR